jgi:hypothetical protein
MSTLQTSLIAQRMHTIRLLQRDLIRNHATRHAFDPASASNTRLGYDTNPL